MSLKALLVLVGWTGLTFLVCLLVDIIGRYKIQVAYVPPPGERVAPAGFGLRLRSRHVLVFLIACFVQFAHRSDRLSITADLLALSALLLPYIVLLVRDSIRDVRADTPR